MAKRPEKQAPAEVYYNTTEAHNYTTSSRIIDVQTKLSQRALELLELQNTPCLLLDIGCGSGLSGDVLTEQGHYWIGVDISEAMLDIALERDVEGDLVLSDIGHGLAVRPGCIDGAVSVSVLQWLCNADRSSHHPRQRLRLFFASLYACLAVGAKAVLQVYPENDDQMDMIKSAALQAGFTGGRVEDNPESARAKKTFLVLSTGAYRVHAESSVKKRKAVQKDSGKGKAWILKKKDQRRRQGFDNVPPDTKYTGRKRKTHFYENKGF